MIDSIIRQCRHQYGVEKDVYGPRFAKNILSTLHQVNKCPADERVLLNMKKIRYRISKSLAENHTCVEPMGEECDISN